MRILILAFLPILLFAQNNTLSPEEQKAGWTLLFDGNTMKNWGDPEKKTPPGNAWNITSDGCLHTISHPNITEDLFSTGKYHDFELTFDWRISRAGNSGVKYRIQDHRFLLAKTPGEKFEATVQRTMAAPPSPRAVGGQDYVIGFEYQITDNAENSDAKNAGPKHSTGALYDMVAPTGAVPRPIGEFNTSRIVVKGDHTEHWLNGVKVVDTTLYSPDALAGMKKRWGASPSVFELLATEPNKDGPISLQNHGDEAWFRNIKIRPL